MERKFILFAILTGVCGIAYARVDKPEWARPVLMLLAVIFGLLTFVYGGDILIDVISRAIQRLRSAWFAPKLALLNVISRMNERQLAFATSIEPVAKVHVKLEREGGLSYHLWTPTGDVPFDWISDYLERCEPRYPDLVPQYGIPDNTDRRYVQMFTSLMVHTGLAEDAAGNKAARWVVPMETVYRKLGFE
jgi:hypothetical protein